jgi:hypothetical protein
MAERADNREPRNLRLPEVSDEALENAAFELQECASHIGWADRRREEEYRAIAAHLRSLRTEARLGVSTNPSAVDLFDPETTPDWVTRWRMLREWIQLAHDERNRLPLDRFQETPPVHLRPEEDGIHV